MLSPAFLARCRFTDAVAADIKRRLRALPATDYISIHVRNTDYTTNYRELFTNIGAYVSGRSVLVCTDDSTVSANVQQMPRRSGFTLLAMALHQEKGIVHQLLACSP
jgi:hypothetical protein